MITLSWLKHQNTRRTSWYLYDHVVCCVVVKWRAALAVITYCFAAQIKWPCGLNLAPFPEFDTYDLKTTIQTVQLKAVNSAPVFLPYRC